MNPDAGHLLRKYLPLVLGVPGCLAAGWFELTRALGGREIAWVYTFEWPFYAVAGSYMWWQIWYRRPSARTASPSKTTTSRRLRDRTPAADDPGLAAWQHYLATLEALDPPGGPPQRR